MDTGSTQLIEVSRLERRLGDWARALKTVTETVDVAALVRQRTGDILTAIGDLIATRIDRWLDEAERERLTIAVDAVEGALSQLVRARPAALQDAGLGATLTWLFLAALDLPEMAIAD